MARSLDQPAWTRLARVGQLVMQSFRFGVRAHLLPACSPVDEAGPTLGAANARRPPPSASGTLVPAIRMTPIIAATAASIFIMRMVTAFAPSQGREVFRHDPHGHTLVGRPNSGSTESKDGCFRMFRHRKCRAQAYLVDTERRHVQSGARQMEEAYVKRLFMVTVGSAILAAACSSTEAPAASTATADDPPTVAEPTRAPASAAGVPAPVTSRVRERAPAAAAAVDRPSSPAGARPASPSPEVPEYREVVLPAGTILPLKLASSVASDRSQVEDAVRATLREDVALEGGSVLPAGVEVVGRVMDVERSGRVKGRARVAFRFTMLQYEGDEYDVRTEAVERVAAATKGEDATKIGIGAGAGAALGAILGGGSGAAKGAAIGAAAGTGAVLATHGEAVRLEPGEAVDTRLTAPLSIRVRKRVLPANQRPKWKLMNSATVEVE